MKNALKSRLQLSRPSYADYLLDKIETFHRLTNLSVNIDASPKSIAHFEGLPLKSQSRILDNFKIYCDLLGFARKCGVPMYDSKKLTWACLQLLKLRPCHDVLEKIQENDVVEIYNTDHIQIFRNLRFFELCSYSIFDVLVYEWTTLYERNATIQAAILDQTQETLNTGRRTINYKNIEPHLLLERFSPEKRKFLIEMGMHSPLFRPDSYCIRPEAVLLTLTATPYERT